MNVKLSLRFQVKKSKLRACFQKRKHTVQIARIWLVMMKFSKKKTYSTERTLRLVIKMKEVS